MVYRSLRCYTHSPSPACANDGAGRLFSTYLAHRVSPGDVARTIAACDIGNVWATVAE